MTRTIAAISTPPARSAVGIIRVSGKDAFACVNKVFVPAFAAPAPRRMTRGTLLDAGGRAIDDCLCVLFPGPDSYTGEDCAEIHCHGSPVVLSLALDALFACGARQALPGEFTKRAFLNGKLDLSQAEAVADLIDSPTPSAARNAAGQLGGALRRKLEGARDAVLGVVSHFQAEVDYPDEGVDPFDAVQACGVLEKAARELERLQSSFSRGRMLRDGILCALIGRPNVGKSSVLNVLAGYDRAIVSPVAGTTRDSIQETVTVGDCVIRLTDTAGIRPGADEIERMGVERSMKAADSAAIVLAVFDGSQPLSEGDAGVIETALKAPGSIAVINKSDLPRRIDADRLAAAFGRVFFVSALTEEGFGELEDAVSSLAAGFGFDGEAGELITNQRQAEAAGRACVSLRSCARAIRDGVTPDAALCDAEAALECIGELTGDSVRDDIIEGIFSRFCVGK